MEDRIVEARQTKRHRLSDNLFFFFLNINPGRTASMHWLAKRLFSTNRQNVNNFRPFSREIKEHAEFQEEDRTSSVSQLYMCSWIEGLNILSGLNHFS